MTNQSVTISANVTDDGGVDSVKLFYRIDGGNYTSCKYDSWQWKQLFRHIFLELIVILLLVDYYIWSKDNDGNVSTMPAAISNVQYFYLVLNRNVTIQDVQYNPFGTDVSGYNGYRVPLTGIVTADTLDDYPGGNFASQNLYAKRSGSMEWNSDGNKRNKWKSDTRISEGTNSYSKWFDLG